MKKIIGTTLFLAASVASAHADEVTYVSDGSPLSSVCIAALDSVAAARSAAADLGLSRYDWADLSCNGMSVKRFSRLSEPTPAPTLKTIAVKTADASPATELCAAAITSVAKYEDLKARHFDGISNLETDVQCNGMPLRSFMLKYSRQDMTAAL